MAIHVPITGAPTRAPVIPAVLTAALSQIDRDDLEALVETAIALLDVADGDIDIEDDDPAGDALDEYGEAPTDTGAPLLQMRPRYALDQSRGPINEHEACRFAVRGGR